MRRTGPQVLVTAQKIWHDPHGSGARTRARAALSRPRRRPARRATQHRGGAGAARCHPSQQRRLRPRLGLSQARAFFRGIAQAHLRCRLATDPRRQGGDADHAEDLFGRDRPRRGDYPAISRPARRRGDGDHQHRGLRAHRLRPRHAARPSSSSARTSSMAPTTRRSTSRRANRSRRPSASSTRSPNPAATTAASCASRTR